MLSRYGRRFSCCGSRSLSLWPVGVIHFIVKTVTFGESDMPAEAFYGTLIVVIIVVAVWVVKNLIEMIGERRNG